MDSKYNWQGGELLGFGMEAKVSTVPGQDDIVVALTKSDLKIAWWDHIGILIHDERYSDGRYEYIAVLKKLEPANMPKWYEWLFYYGLYLPQKGNVIEHFSFSNPGNQPSARDGMSLIIQYLAKVEA